ncbi:MAG: Xaa-Pro peptidase family protein, partial [Proteobacteria bacterium]|nr:Xaa-Pro peptidase family protein [Pseudomonadota bacterium]
ADYCGSDKRLAVDRIDPLGAEALTRHGVKMVDASRMMERARVIKSSDEIFCMKVAVAACEAGMGAMREALAPGMTENELWSLLHQANIARNGEWIETRCLASGERTNPWLQECSDRVIRAGELVAYDTDLIGPFGYMADISRTYYCVPGTPSDEQRRLYSLSFEQLEHDVALLAPGMSFREYAERAWPIPEEFVANRYGCVAHGVGMCDEFPTIGYPTGPGLGNVDGVFEPGMTICVESYVLREGGAEGVKLEQQLLVTEHGTELLSTFPFEKELQ